MAAQPPSYKTLASLSRINLLHQLQQRGTMTVGDLAEAAGLHHNTAREHLDRLISEGFVTCEPEPRQTKGRPRMLYSAARGVDSDASSVRGKKVEAALIRAEQLRRMLPLTPVDRPTAGAVTVGAECGAAADAAAVRPTHPAVQRQFDALDDHLDQSGFDARVTDDQQHVTLHDCPYSEMVKDHPEVCGVHFKLIQGVLEQAEGPLRAHQLHLIEAPRLCTIDLHHASPAEIAADRAALEAAVSEANVVVDAMVAVTAGSSAADAAGRVAEPAGAGLGSRRR
ncbi:MarR family transcriptional regulator [Cryobacterium melibiosiphilum]|uniref:MarR family transcriptional regulator n=1 Tax=Cryobacterium melibiosiphilum TaxID=995039 RepID=A0A3A5ML94_9MICO|nr:helix-turn-helix domain-containing protein [Cryobacterium melibiosiphilum]RJT90867.1 MarR family transcriptional regulator [Cryobacterium melibiosiphilum]